MEKFLSIPQWLQWLSLVPLGAVLVAAAVMDWRERKIYNWLTYPAFGVGLVMHTVTFGFNGLLAGFLTALVVVVIGMIILPFGWLGGGDIKLLAVIGAWLGPGPLYEVFFYAVFSGFVMGICVALVNGYLWTMTKRIGRFLKSLFLSAVSRTNLTQEVETDERAYLPFAIPILVGAVFATTDVYLQWPLFMDWVRELMQGVSRT